MSDTPSPSDDPLTPANSGEAPSPPTPPPSSSTLPPSSPPLRPSRMRRWRRYVIYTLAFLGLVLIGLAAFVTYKIKTEPGRTKIDESEVIDTIMTRTYGKYSEEKKGWLFVGNDNRNYLVRVIQQAKPEDGPKGDELYFVASGAPLDELEGGVYGVFHVRASDKPGEAGKLVEISSPYEYDGSAPVQPDWVHFEALSSTVWGWVIKVQEGPNPKLAPVEIKNVMLAPHGDEIATLATFKAVREADPGIDCAAANARYDAFMKPPVEPVGTAAKAENADGADATKPVDPNEAAETSQTAQAAAPEEAEAPMRCDQANWSYSTGTPVGTTPGPLTITFSGMLDGAQQPGKTWKLVFDTKGFVYNVPDELQPDSSTEP